MMVPSRFDPLRTDQLYGSLRLVTLSAESRLVIRHRCQRRGVDQGVSTARSPASDALGDAITDHRLTATRSSGRRAAARHEADVSGKTAPEYANLYAPDARVTSMPPRMSRYPVRRQKPGTRASGNAYGVHQAPHIEISSRHLRQPEGLLARPWSSAATGGYTTTSRSRGDPRAAANGSAESCGGRAVALHSRREQRHPSLQGVRGWVSAKPQPGGPTAICIKSHIVKGDPAERNRGVFTRTKVIERSKTPITDNRSLEHWHPAGRGWRSRS